MRACWKGLLILGLAAPESRAAMPGPPPRGASIPTLYFFFSPLAPSGPEAARKATHFVLAKPGTLRLRPVLLIETFSGIGALDEQAPLHRTLQELQSLGPLELPLVDEDGLHLAETWGLRSVPAFVLVRQGRAHRAVGPRADLDALLACTP